MSTLTIHVLDTSRGHPAAGVPVRLEHLTGGEPAPIAGAGTDDDGRGSEGRERGPGRFRAAIHRRLARQSN